MATTQKKKILFICSPDSPHANSWMNLFNDSDFDVRVFSVYHFEKHERSLSNWNFPTYSLFNPRDLGRIKNKIINHTLSNVIPEVLFRSIVHRFKLRRKWIKKIITRWEPDIIHSFPLNTGGKPAVEALKQIDRKKWPKWVVSSWGSDLYLGLDGEKRERERLGFILNNCDGFFSDCGRDLKLAKENGLSRTNLKFAYNYPGTGGLDLEYFGNLRKRKQKRNIILVPKAFEREHANRIFPFLEALTLLGSELEVYEIHLLMCSDSVRKWIKKFPDHLQQRCILHDMISQSDLFTLLGRTRVMVALSLSDGTPNVMLEAMAAGAIPLMHPLDSIREWITDKQNGLLAHALYPNKIAKALIHSLTNDNLFYKAHEQNWVIINSKANRQRIKEQVISHYESLIN